MAIEHFDQAKIATVYNMKGGCGKTMVSMQLGGSLARRGYRSIIIDMDSQGTSVMWSGQADAEMPFPATVVSLSAAGGKMVGEVEKLSKNHDFIIIDCPPAIESMIPWAALNISDVGLMPFIPVADNFWASKKAKELGMRAKEENPDLSLFYVPSMLRRSRVLDGFMEQLAKDEDVGILCAGLGQRNAYIESQVYGTTVHSLSRSSQAVAEVEELTDKFLSLFGR